MLSPAKVINRGFSLMWLMDRVFLAKYQYSEYFKFLVEVVILAETVGQGIE